ncbi:MAG: hypothetical protein GEV12_03780 [Micromonosporaceae bacterium]|nr:hypothetical protein [Micromonosporaceae bacterium]
MTGSPPLGQSVRALLTNALELYHDSPATAGQLHHQLSRFEEPLRVAVTGPWRSGKSTLVNALMGEQVAPVEVPDGQQVFTWYQDGSAPHAVAYPAGYELPVSRTADGMSVDVRRWQPAPVNDLVVTWPTRTLRHTTLVDTPAVPDAGVEAPPTAVADMILRDVDVVLYLTRDARDTDLHFLQRAQAGLVARAAPVNLLLVLSRADELGGGRLDALIAARQLARRQHRDPRVGSLCLGVVAVSGLVALAGRVLGEPDFAALATLAATPRAELDGFLLSTDRFIGQQFPAPVAVEARRALLDRLGIFGVRLAVTLIRTGSDSRAALAAELVRRSGLTDLREAVARCFVDRREVLQARSALAALESILHTDPRPGVERLSAGLEHVLTTSHDLRELRLLAWLRLHRVGFDGDLAAEARRLVGENGTGVAARLGVDRPTTAELWRLSADALARWRELADDPVLRLDQRRAAQVVVRSCEGIQARLRHRP